VSLSFVDDRQVLIVIMPMLHLHECADPAAVEPLHSVGDSTVVEESVVEPLHSVVDPAAAKSAVEPLQFVADLDATADALIETSCS
jgi:hypothetical protein